MRRTLPSRGAAPVLLSLTLALGVVAGLRQHSVNAAVTARQFRAMADRVMSLFQHRMQTYEYEVRGARGAVLGAGGDSITRERFREYSDSRDVAREFPGSLGFGFIRRVSVAAEAAFVAAARDDGAPDFAIQRFAAHDGERFVIQYIEPQQPNAAAIGMDIGSESNRREAALHAMRSGEATLTGPIDLVQLGGPNRTGFLLLLPIYRFGMPHTTEQERVSATIGWAYAPLALSHVLTDLGHDSAALSLHIADLSSPDAPQPIVSTPARQPLHAIGVVVDAHVFTRAWRVSLTPTAVFFAQLNMPDPRVVGVSVALVGVLIAAIFCLYVWSVERRSRLSTERDRLASIVESSGDAIIGEDLLGLVTSWNAGATRLFGYSAEEMLGQPLTRLYVEAERDEIERLRDRARAGELSQQVNAVRVTKAGHHVYVNTTNSPVHDAGGRIVGLSIIARDTTERMLAEAALRMSERHFRDLAESLPHMVWTCGSEGTCDYLSPQWVTYTGIAERVQLGYGWLAQLHPDDVAETKSRWGEAARTGGSFDVEFRIRRHDGAYRWFKTRAVPIRDPDGRISRWFGSNTDIQDLLDAQEAMKSMARELEVRVASRTDELRVANAQLEFTARQLQIAQRLAQVGSGTLDVVTGAITWSRQLHSLFGEAAPQNSLTLAAHERFFTPASWVRLQAVVENTLATGVGYELRLDVVRRDGTMRVVIARGEVVRNSAGKIDQLVGTLQDVTEQELVRSQLEQLTLRLQLATSAAKMGVWDWHIRDNVLIWDEIMHRLYDTAERKFSGTYDAWRDALHPADRAETERALREAIAGLGEFNPSFRIVRPNGEIRYLRAASTVYRDSTTGEALRVVGVNLDITEQRNAELSLRSGEALQRAILTHAGSAIIATDPAGLITLFNRAAEELLGYRASEMVRVTTPSLFHDPEEMAARRSVLAAELGAAVEPGFDVLVAKARLGKVDANEWTYVRKDGSRVPVLSTVSALRDDGGEVFGYLGVAIDLSSQKAHQRELKSLNRLLAERSILAESASRAKSLFLANMSHEIRTPIGAITGVTYLLARSGLSADQRGLVRTIDRSSKALLGMMNDVLDLSKIEAGQFTLDLTRFGLGAVLDDIAGIMAGYATGKPLELVVDTDPQLPDALVGDRHRLLQILINLVGNAIKFTDTGSVRLHVRAEGLEAGRAWIGFDVHDSGPGIGEATLSQLFIPFKQGEQSSHRRVGGTGLGLAIVKQLAVLMGGSVGVDSTLGVGSRFWCKLPFERREESAAAGPSSWSVVIVEGHEAQRNALLAHAERHGWNALSVSTGARALSLLEERSRDGQVVDAIIVDWDTLGKDGLDVLAALRASPLRGGAPASIVIASTHDVPTLRGLPGAKLASLILGKPITASMLREAVSEAMAARSRTDGSSARASSPYSSSRLQHVRVLLVDDSAVNREVARRILELEGALVTTADDGRAAVECVVAADGHYDLVLMDVQMPDMDGVEAARRIRENPATASLPIIALTAGALTSERQRALDAGMDDFVSKPFDPEALVLSVRGRVLPRERLPGDTAAGSTSSGEPGWWPTIEGIDSADCRLRLRGDLDLFRELLQRALIEFAASQHALGASEGQSLPPLAGTVHKLKGVAGNVGAGPLMKLADAFERVLGGQHEPADDTRARLFAELVAVQRAIESALASWQTVMIPDAGRVATDDGDWNAFIAAVFEHSVDAIELFQSGRFRARLGANCHEQLAVALNAYDFATARELLAESAQKTAEPVEP